MNKENWISEVIESTKGMRKAEPSPFLFEQITKRIQKGKEVVEADPFLKWGLAAFVLIILSLNVISIVNTNVVVTQETTMGLGENYFNNSTTYNY